MEGRKGEGDEKGEEMEGRRERIGIQGNRVAVISSLREASRICFALALLL